jgi:hypothetical protein
MTKQHQSFASCSRNMKYFYVHWYMQTGESFFAKVKNKYLLSLEQYIKYVCRISLLLTPFVIYIISYSSMPFACPVLFYIVLAG